MATRKIRLTRKRKTYASEREKGRLVGLPLTPPAAPAERYSNELGRLTAEMYKAYQREIEAVFRANPAITTDASISSQVGMVLASLQRRFAKLFAERSKPIVERLTSGVDKAAQSTLNASLRQLSGGLTLKTDKMPAALTQAMKASTLENVALIKSIPAQYHGQIEGAVTRSLQPGGKGAADVRGALERYKGVTDRRKDFIARDQTRKINAAIGAERAKSAGVKKFKWLHSAGGSEPRPEHVAMSGEVFSYDDLPIIDRRTGERGLPGQLPNCRCQAVPVLEWGDEE